MSKTFGGHTLDALLALAATASDLLRRAKNANDKRQPLGDTWMREIFKLLRDIAAAREALPALVARVMERDDFARRCMIKAALDGDYIAQIISAVQSDLAREEADKLAREKEQQ